MQPEKTELDPIQTQNPTAARRRGSKRKVAAFVLAAFAATMTLTACPEEKGPAEKAGEAIDNGADKLKDAVTPDGPGEKLGKKLDKATGSK